MKYKAAGKTKKKMYFTQVHEDAIVRYCQVDDDMVERNYLYEEFIGPAFNEMVDKIVYTYKFTSLPNIDRLKQECKINLITILDKYDPNKGSKAFSYFSVVTKNFFIQKIKKISKRNKIEKDFEDITNITQNRNLVVYNDYLERRDQREFWQHLLKEIDDWIEVASGVRLKKRELSVLLAIKEIFDSKDKVEIFNKKAIYMYMREITGLSTKQITASLSKIRKRYHDFKRQWDKCEI